MSSANPLLQPVPWTAPLSRELLVFNSFLRALSRNLRVLVEQISLNMLLRGDARKARDDLLDIALSLPFQVDTNTGFGILSKVYLDALTHLNGGECVTDRNAEGVADIKSTALDIVEETFASSVKNPRLEVERGFRFWDVVRQMVILGYCLAANYVNMYRRSLVSGLWQPRQAVFFPTSHRRSTTPTPGSRLCARERLPRSQPLDTMSSYSLADNLCAI